MSSDRRPSVLQRRTFLRGLGTCMAVPGLERWTVSPKEARAATRPLAITQTGAPLRLAFIMFPNGVSLKHWRPMGAGRAFQLNDTFRPLARLQQKIQIFSGFAQDSANANGDGAGDHARASAAFLTGCRPRKTAGADIRNGVSVDQIAAQRIGHLTRLASLELGSEKSRRTGACDSGYSCAYQYNISWASETLPVPSEADPRQVFERLFGAGPRAERQRAYLARHRQRKSVVDFVLEDARTLERDLGANDRRKIDEYLDSVRATERQIEKAERFKLPKASMRAPAGIPPQRGEHIRLMFDLLALAFESDSTRVATFALAREGSNRSFAEIGIPEGHHHLSHHQRHQEKLQKVARIDLFYMEQFARFLARLDASRDADGRSVLENSIILYGCAISDGDRHNHNDLPIVLAGAGGGLLHPGRHVELGAKVPLTNLFLTMLEGMNVPAERVGDSSGPFTDV
jgi:hypothetical protein